MPAVNFLTQSNLKKG